MIGRDDDHLYNHGPSDHENVDDDYKLSKYFQFDDSEIFFILSKNNDDDDNDDSDNENDDDENDDYDALTLLVGRALSHESIVVANLKNR